MKSLCNFRGEAKPVLSHQFVLLIPHIYMPLLPHLQPSFPSNLTAWCSSKLYIINSYALASFIAIITTFKGKHCIVSSACYAVSYRILLGINSSGLCQAKGKELTSQSKQVLAFLFEETSQDSYRFPGAGNTRHCVLNS